MSEGVMHEEKKKIKIAFTDFWPEFNIYDNIFVTLLLKHYNVEIIDALLHPERKEEVEYLFYSMMGYNYLGYNCVRIFYTGENIVPDFNLCDYAIGFEHMSIQDRYIRIPLYCIAYREDVEGMETKKNSSPETLKALYNRKFCAMVVSNGNNADSFRQDLFEKLSHYRKVDSGGRFANNIGKPEGIDNKKDFLAAYKFSFAVENVSHKGYCTEKIVQSFAANTVPIYWGDSSVVESFNKKAFINCNDFNSIEAIVDYIKKVDQDDNLYGEMLSSVPILENQMKLADYDRELESFLCGIISQPYAVALRRNLCGSMNFYENSVRERNKWDDFIVKRGKISTFQRLQCLKMFIKGRY